MNNGEIKELVTVVTLLVAYAVMTVLGWRVQALQDAREAQQASAAQSARTRKS